MSETETRDAKQASDDRVSGHLCDAGEHAWTWTRPIEGGDGWVGVCSLCRRITTAERDAATQDELSRLRAVVEAVQAGVEPFRSWDPYDPVIDAIDDALAVSSSGEAESGEGPVLACVEPGCFMRYASTGTPQAARRRAAQEGWTFYDGDLCPEHSPAPVLSGGQADGEGERLPVVAYKGPHDTDASLLLGAAQKAEQGYPVGGSNVGRAVAQVLRDAVARAQQPARPVLSREAVADLLVQQTVRVQVPNVGTVTGFLRRESADHLADVLAGGEQA